jgi:hypothetical protein
MTSTIKILDRVKKLLALAKDKGGNANEVAAAAALAASLMQAHKLTEADVPTEDPEGPDMVDLPAGADFLDSWRFVLVTCVARSFMCEAVGLRSAGRRKVRVVGRREDVEVALEVYRHLAGELERLTAAYEGEEDDFYGEVGDLWGGIFGYGGSSIDRARFAIEGRRGGYRRPVPVVSPERRAIYRDGLVAGVATKLRQQKATFEESGERAMVVARKSKEDIRKHIANKFAEPKTVERTVPRSESVEEMDFARGFIRGQQVVVDQSPQPKEPANEIGIPTEGEEIVGVLCGDCGRRGLPGATACGSCGASYEVGSRPKKIKVVVQKWEESERGWGCRPDGYSIHPDEEARKRYVAAHFKSMKEDFGEEAPDEYDRPNGTPYEAEVDEVEIEGDGRRYYEGDYPGHGGYDGWVRR